MARIDSLGESWQYPVSDRKKASRKDKAQRREFAHLVESAAEGAGADTDDLDHGRRHPALQELLDDVFAAGDRLKKTQTLDAIKEYRQKVKAFVQYAVDHSIAVEETTSGLGILNRKRFTLVRVIDEKLESLAVSVLAAQKDQIGMLAQIDEINGLLVDLMS
jgi:uncharacterized protein